MTKTENERLAIVEEQINYIKEEQINYIKSDISEMKSDIKTLLSSMPSLCNDMERLKRDVEEHDAKINSALWMTLTAIVAFIGSALAWFLKGLR